MVWLCVHNSVSALRIACAYVGGYGLYVLGLLAFTLVRVLWLLLVIE